MKKSIVAIIMVFVLVAAFFSGCSRIPKEPPETTLEKHSYINPVGETIIADEAYFKRFGTNIKYVKTIGNVELSLNSYYVYGKNAASMEVKELSYDGISIHPEGEVDIKIISIGKRADNMKIGYTAYDAQGKVILKSHILIKLKGVKRNDVITRRFHFPKDCAKVVFHDYVDPAKK